MPADADCRSRNPRRADHPDSRRNGSQSGLRPCRDQPAVPWRKRRSTPARLLRPHVISTAPSRSPLRSWHRPPGHLTPSPVIAGETRLSYADLAARAARIANTLRAMGVGQGSLVGLSCRRTVDMVAGALGIQLAGAAYVPMDPAYPADRLDLYAEDSRRQGHRHRKLGVEALGRARLFCSSTPTPALPLPRRHFPPTARRQKITRPM